MGALGATVGHGKECATYSFVVGAPRLDCVTGDTASVGDATGHVGDLFTRM